MIGKIYSTTFSFYNAREKKMDYKSRPALIIGKADSEDYVVLPVSSITHSNKINPYYDIKIETQIYKLLNLKKNISYIRTNKQTVVHYKEISTEIANLKDLYPELFKLIMDRVAEFQKNIQQNAFINA